MRNSLFLKVYLTLIASLVVVALASAAFVRLSHDEEDRGWGARRDAFVAAMLPADATPAETRIVLARLAAALDADIALFTPDGALIAGVGGPLPFPGPKGKDDYERGDGRLMAARLDDGRVAVARFAKGPFGPSRPRPLAWLALIAGVTGLVAWPVVRHLTSRLERLRHGVEAWGGGDLALRVPVEGGDEVAAVAASFNRAADRIEGLVAAHRSLLANASHELRSPLARLRMALESLPASPAPATEQEIRRNIQELDQLIDEILLASRLDAQPAETERFEATDLVALAAEECARAGAELSVPPPMPAAVRGDPRLLRRLVRNLVENARRHAPATPIDVALYSGAPGRVVLDVCDRGAGVPTAERERIFEPFYRLPGSTEATGGAGLGLALVRTIATRHGGSVVCLPRDGGGTCFRVDLPAA